MKLDPRIFLYLDFETRSPVDIKKAGLENYARNAEVLMLGWAVNDSPVKLWVPAPKERQETVPFDLSLYLRRPEIIKVAWNAAFERAILKYALGIDVPVDQWMDPSAMSRYASGPSHLALASEVYGLYQVSPVAHCDPKSPEASGPDARVPANAAGGSQGKDRDGARLIRKFCVPKKTSKDPVGRFVTPAEAPEDWQKFQAYCKQDVIAEREVFKKLLPAFELPESERKILALDQKINERGIPVDTTFVMHATQIVCSERGRLMNELRELTGLENPNSTQQLLGWLRERGYPYSSLGKKWVDAVMEDSCTGNN